jgi:hypothetical protein
MNSHATVTSLRVRESNDERPQQAAFRHLNAHVM